MANYSITQIMFMFFLFCNYGWIQESIIESLYHKRVINRGFLRGPYIPIYGIGGMTLLFVCMPFEENGFAVYFVGLISCTVLEYFVGWLMEKLFHKQFWDYSMLKLTYKNRISLLSSLFWGLMALFMVYVLYSPVDALVHWVDPVFIGIYDLVMTIAMCVDAVISVSNQISFREKLKKLPVEKAKRLVMDKFIQLGGSVAKRRERLTGFLVKMKLIGVEKYSEEEEPREDNDLDEDEEETN